MNLLMLNLAQVQEREQILRIFLEAMDSLYPQAQFTFIPGEAEAGKRLDGEDPDESEGTSLELATARRRFGRIAWRGESYSGEEGAEIRNAIQLLAIILENRYQAEQLQEEVDDKTYFLEKMMDSLPGLIYVYDLKKQRNTFANRRLHDFLGITPEEARAKGAEFLSDVIHPEDLPRVEAHHCSLAEDTGNRMYQITYRIQAVRGEWRWIESRDLPYSRDEEGRTDRILGTAVDVTEAVEARDQLAASLREKDLLLREIHHRVKNNLQIMGSLLNLQKTRMDSPADEERLEESEQRIQVMAMVHEQLYEKENLEVIGLDVYFRHLFQGYRSFCGCPLTYQVEIPGIALDIARALPVALIFNELVINSLRHAFPEGAGEPSLILRGEAGEGGGFLFRYEDNGRGFPPDFRLEEASGLGFQMIQGLTEQLQGSYRYGNSPQGGSWFELTLPGG